MNHIVSLFPYWTQPSKFRLGPELLLIYAKNSCKAISPIVDMACLPRHVSHLILRILSQICSNHPYYSTHSFSLELKVSDSSGRDTESLVLAWGGGGLKV